MNQGWKKAGQGRKAGGFLYQIMAFCFPAMQQHSCSFCIFVREAAPDRDEPQFPHSKSQQKYLCRCLNLLGVVEDTHGSWRGEGERCDVVIAGPCLRQFFLDPPGCSCSTYGVAFSSLRMLRRKPVVSVCI